MTEPKKILWWEYLLLALIVTAGAFLRWHEIGDKSIWLDESFSLWMAQQSIPDLFGWITRIDQHPFLYYLSMHFWTQLGQDEATVRSFSAILSTLTIPVMYFAARRMLGTASAIFAAALLAFSAFNVHYAQEARMYALLCFNVASVLLALSYLLTGDHRLRWWAIYAIFGALVLFTHNVAVLFPVAVNVAFLLILFVNRLRKDTPDLEPPSFKHWVFGQLALALIWLPWAPSFVRQVILVDHEFWIPAPTTDFVVGTIGTWFADWRPWGEDWILWAAGAAVILAIISLIRRPALLLYLLTLVILPVALSLLVSLRRPIFYDRTLIYITLPLFILLSASVGVWMQQKSRNLRLIALPGAAAMLLLMGGNLVSLQNYYDNFHKEEWREAAKWVADRTGPNDALLFNATWIQLPFEYYFDQSGKDVPKLGAPVNLFDAGVLEPKMTKEDVPYLQERIEAFDCIWLVYSHDWYTDPSGIVPRTMRYAMVPSTTKDFVGLKVMLYERRGAPTRCGQLQDQG